MYSSAGMATETTGGKYEQYHFTLWIGIAAYSALIATMAVAAVFVFRGSGSLFSSGIIHYQLSSLFSWVSPSELIIVFAAVGVAAASVIYRTFLVLGLRPYVAWVSGALFALAPVLYQQVFPLHIYLLIMVGVPIAFYLLATGLRTRWGAATVVVWMVCWTLMIPQAGVWFLVMAGMGYWWFRQRNEHHVIDVKSFVALAGISLIAATVISPYTSVLTSWFTLYEPRGIFEAALYYGVDLNWLIDMPLSALFSGYFPVNPLHVHALSIPALILPAAIMVVLLYVKKKALDKEKRALLFWFSGIALAGMVLSLGPVLKYAGEVVQPHTPLPGLALVWYQQLEHIPYYFIGFALYGCIGAVALVATVYANAADKQLRLPSFGLLAVFLAQYGVVSSFSTSVLTEQNYDVLQQDESQVGVLELQPDQLYERYLSEHRQSDHTHPVISRESDEGRYLMRVLQAVHYPLVPQHQPEDAASVFHYYNVRYIDRIKQTVEAGTDTLIDASSEIPLIEEVDEESAVLEGNPMLEISHHDGYHTLYAVRELQPIDSYLQFIQTDPWTAEIQVVETEAGEEFRYVKFINGGQLRYYNFTERPQEVALTFNYSSLRYIRLAVLVDGELTGTYEIEKFSEGLTLTTPLGSLAPGEHAITLSMSKRDGTPLNNLNTMSGLQAHSIEYQIGGEKTED